MPICKAYTGDAISPLEGIETMDSAYHPSTLPDAISPLEGIETATINFYQTQKAMQLARLRVLKPYKDTDPFHQREPMQLAR